MKKDRTALFLLFSVLTYVPLAEAKPPECEKITTSAVMGQGRYAVYCGEELVKDDDGYSSFSEAQANDLLERKQREADQDNPDPKDEAPFSN